MDGKPASFSLPLHILTDMNAQQRLLYDAILDAPGENAMHYQKQTGLSLPCLLSCAHRLQEMGAIVIEDDYIDPGAYRFYHTLSV